MKLHKAVNSATSLILAISMAGCAAMFHGTTQMVSIRSNVDDAKLYVNEAYIGTGSGVTTFRKNKNYIIVARKAGCSDGVAIPTKSFDAVTLLGILLDYGIISILVVDGACTGAWNQFDQTSYVVDPQCPGSGCIEEQTFKKNQGTIEQAAEDIIDQVKKITEQTKDNLQGKPTQNF